MMKYNSVALQQLQGQELLTGLNKAYAFLMREEELERSVAEQFRYLDNLESDKEVWTITNAMQHPVKWVVVVSAALSALVVLKYATARPGDMLIPFLLAVFSFIGLFTGSALFLTLSDKRLKKMGVKRQNRTGISLILLIGIMLLFILFGGGKGFGWLFVFYGLVGLYTALCWLDAKIVHKNQRGQELKQHFTKKDEEAALELGWRLTSLQNFRDSDAMAFAHAMVPEDFQNVAALGELLSVMRKYSAYDLHTGIQDYYQEKHMQKMEFEAERQRQAQEQATAEQRAQTKILEWQRRDNEWHNREMEYQQQRQNETLRDMRRDQKEHNDRVDRFLDDLRDPFIDF